MIAVGAGVERGGLTVGASVCVAEGALALTGALLRSDSAAEFVVVSGVSQLTSAPTSKDAIAARTTRERSFWRRSADLTDGP